MIGYVSDRAAEDEVVELESGKWQSVYCTILNDAWRACVVVVPSASTIYQVVSEGDIPEWRGSPSKLLACTLG